MEEQHKPNFFSQVSYNPNSLYETGLLDSDPEPEFDQLTAISVRALNVPVALISLIDTDRQFFKSHCGLEEPLASHRQTSLEYSFCQHVVVIEEPLVIPDAHLDPLVYNNRAVTELGVRSYIGVPLTNGRGNIIGSVCVLDFVPREWTESDVEVLSTIAGRCASEIDMRLTAAEHIQDLEDLHKVQKEQNRAVRDLRIPFSALRSNLNVLPLLGSVNKDQKESIEFARRSIRMIEKLLAAMLNPEVLDGSKSITLNCAGYFLQDLVESAVEQVALLAAQKDVRLEVDVIPSIPAISVDGEKLVRVVVYLIGSVVNSTLSGGKVLIALREDHRDEASYLTLRISSEYPEDFVKGECRADSDGHALNAQQSGSQPVSIDIAFCQCIVEAHGGRIVLDSVIDREKSYTLAIPIDV